jgi:hypothetical protein
VRIAVQPAGASRFRPAQLIERSAVGLAGAPSGSSLAPIITSIEGRAPIVIFVARDEGASAAAPPETASVVRVAYPKGLGFGPPATISAAGKQAGDIAAATSAGGAMVTWITGSYDMGVVSAVVLAPGASRAGAPEQVLPATHVMEAAPVYSARSSRWLVAWVGRPEYRSWREPGRMLAQVTGFTP